MIDSTRQKQLIGLRTKNSTVTWPADTFPIMLEAAEMYSDIVVIFDQYQLQIDSYDDLQQVGNTLPKGFNPENEDVKAASSILFGFLSFNANSNQFIKAILSPYTHLTNGYAALYALMFQTTSWFCNEKLNWANTPFTDDIDSSYYATIILNSVKAAFKSGGTEYSLTDQSKEMSYQIMKGENIPRLLQNYLQKLTSLLLSIQAMIFQPTFRFQI